VPIIANLRPCRESQSAGFTRWRIMVGEGLLRREIKAVDAMKLQPASRSML
jgi:hypothetical protein